MTVRLFNGMMDRGHRAAGNSCSQSRVVARSSPTQFAQQMNVLMAHARGDTDEHVKDVQALLEEHKGHVSYELVIGFMMFAALAAREDDLLSKKRKSFAGADEDAKVRQDLDDGTLRSHVTIRIGPSGERHLVEREARRQFKRQASGRAFQPNAGERA